MILDVGAQLRKGVIEYCILGALAHEPMYGWQLARELTGPGLIASIGTLYPVLGRLRERGLIAAFLQDAQAGPVRKYYRVTEEGRRELVEFRRQWAPFTRAVEELIGEVEGDGR